MSFKKCKIGESIKLKSRRFKFEKDCIVTSIRNNEINLTYYDNECKEIVNKVLTLEDVKYNDYELVSLH